MSIEIKRAKFSRNVYVPGRGLQNTLTACEVDLAPQGIVVADGEDKVLYPWALIDCVVYTPPAEASEPKTPKVSVRREKSET